MKSAAPAKFVSWEKIPSDRRPSELPPIFQKALANQPNGMAGQTMEDDRGEAIVGALNAEWARQNGSSSVPSPIPVLYEGTYFRVVFVHSYTSNL